MKASPFQVVLTAIFIIALVGGVIVLALTKAKNGSVNSVTVVIWGTMDTAAFNDSVSNLTLGTNGYKIEYIQKIEAAFDQDLIEALASGVGPDAILLPQDKIIKYRDKILPFSYNIMPLRDFKDTFIQEAELYIDSEGVVALPFTVDPLVMYWNRDSLTNIGESLPPKTWDQFITLVPRLSVKDANSNILKSGVALGEFKNITNAFEIISAILLQAGSPITQYGPDGLMGALSPTLATIGAVNFYTDFANPLKPDYSWNRALINSRDMFASGDLAFYFGFASEMSKIRDRNSNLNFDVTYFPQPKGASILTTFGKMQGLAVLKSSQNQASAVSLLIAMTAPDTINLLSSRTGLPPVRRSMLVADPKDPYQAIFYNSALRAKAWVDPNSSNSRAAFQNMIESITSGEAGVGDAITIAGKSLRN
ncbi:MAG: extracellular solute-binding protein [Patescibacteria group bacterium]